MREQKGIIISVVAGFYYVKTESGVVTCRAKGIFRKDNIKPLVGDNVTIEIDTNGEGMVAQIEKRENAFVRPPIANLDAVVIVVSTVSPAPNFLIIDKMLSLIHFQGAQGAIVITKQDLKDHPQISEIYKSAKIKVFDVEYQNRESLKDLKQFLSGKISAFVGNSGVGKSTLLNGLYENLDLETGETSQKLGRGKHTTRTVDLYEIPSGGFIADTPGFSSVDLLKNSKLTKEDLPFTFFEFTPFLNNCKFTGCSHTVEKGCGVLQAVKDGVIHRVRHENYVSLYNELKNLKEWEMRR